MPPRSNRTPSGWLRERSPSSAAAVGGTVQGDPGREVHGVNGLAEAQPGEIVFFNNPKYRDQLAATRASAVVIEAASVSLLGGRDAIVAKDAYLAFAKISTVFHPRPAFAPGVDPRAVVEAGAEVDPAATVMAFSYVGRGARIGPRAVLMPSTFVGDGAQVGADALLYPHVVVREGCTVGERAILQPGVILGGDGFGFAFDPSKPEHFKIPQVGTAEVQADVEIGANSAIDRATLGKTVIGRGSKLDNLVQVGHNVQVGPLCILCGQVGLAGSSQLGQGVVCGGQVGIANHAKVADGTKVAAQSGIKDSIEERGQQFMGSPVMPMGDYARALLAFQKGAETLKTVRKLEKRIAELEAKLAAIEKAP
ncbi:MAG: UDP-3-O-(3-hydroxymyristoyl)glucosamine N-acyltransferase [Myxococcales bacterium]